MRRKRLGASGQKDLAFKAWWLLPVLPLVLVLVFHVLNVPHLRTDSGFFLQDAYEAAIGLRAEGLAAFASIPAEFHKPMLAGLSGAVAVLLSGFSLKGALALHGVAMLGLLIAYLFLSLEKIFGLSRPRAAAGALLVGTLPWLFSLYTMFEGESVYLPLALAAAYHLFRSERFSKSASSVAFAFYAALATLARPFEAALLLGVPALIFMAQGLARREVCRAAPLALGVAMPLVFAWFYSARVALANWVNGPLHSSQPVGPWTLQVSDVFPAVFVFILGPAPLLLIAASAFGSGKSNKPLSHPRARLFALGWLCLGPVAVTSAMGKVYSPHYFYASFLVVWILLAALALTRASQLVVALAVGWNILQIGVGLFQQPVARIPLRMTQYYLDSMEPLSREPSKLAQLAQQVAGTVATDSKPLPIVGTILFHGFSDRREEIDYPAGLNVMALANRHKLRFTRLVTGAKRLPDLTFPYERRLECMSYVLAGPRPSSAEQYSGFTSPSIKAALHDWLGNGFAAKGIVHVKTFEGGFDLFRNPKPRPQACPGLLQQARRQRDLSKLF